MFKVDWFCISCHQKLSEKFIRHEIDYLNMFCISCYQKISEKFINVSLVDRHRMIYSIFKDKIVTEIHALQIQAYTLEEWKKKKISN